jgi:DNA-directed RNA polymerase specialized sigma24 family protein
MFQSTVTENFESWDNFLDAYYQPIRTALKLLPYVGESRADDLAQSFFMKMYERDILDRRPAITGKFRNWLYVAARRHAVDEWRKRHRRPERSSAPGDPEPVDPNSPGAEDSPFDADEFYALSILHMTVARVRKHLIEEGKSEHWMIFEELVLAPLMPGRVAKTREELQAMFPGQPSGFLDNRITTVKRVFRRILPALVPADPTENLTPEERFQELLEILRASKDNRLWLAFLTRPATSSDASTGSSLELAAPSSADEPADAMISPEILHDELRVLLGFWLDMPLNDYLDDLEGAGPTVARVLKDARPPGPLGLSRDLAPALTLNGLIAGSDPTVATIPPAELTVLLERLKTFAKRVHKAAKEAEKADNPPGATRRENSMPGEIAQVLYDLAGALALTRCGARVVGLSDERYRKNVFWLLNQPWLDIRLRPVFSSALKRLDS